MLCKTCNADLTGQQTKYCSIRCKSVYWAKVRTKRTVYTLVCSQCDSNFESVRGGQRYCNKKCASKARIKSPIPIPDRLKDPSRKIDKALGYVRVYCPEHPNANTRGYYYEHRLIVEQSLGRFLHRNEHVHHRNGVRWDNRLVNLEVLSPSEHSKLRGQRDEDLTI